MNAGAFLAIEPVGLRQLTSSTRGLREGIVNILWGDVVRHSSPGPILYRCGHLSSAGMTKALVKPKDLTDLVRSDSITPLSSETGILRRRRKRRNRRAVGDNTSKALGILKVDRHIQEVTDIDVEHVGDRIYSALMEKDALQINSSSSRDLEGDLEAFETENSYTDESIRSAREDSYLTDDGAKNKRSVLNTHAYHYQI